MTYKLTQKQIVFRDYASKYIRQSAKIIGKFRQFVGNFFSIIEYF